LKDLPEVCVEQTKERHIFLKEDTKRGWHTKDESPTNLLIEGENYQALRMLEFTHSGKIDVIYIDPPYNTGNKDFVYDDDFSSDAPDSDEEVQCESCNTVSLKYVDVEDAFRHSKWVSFMERRLRLARNLLSEKGVILISIDDNEYAHLKLLCDAVFGESNFINNIVWLYENSTMKNPSKKLASMHEYVLMYCKNKSSFEINKIREDDVSDKLIKRFGRYANENGEILLKSVPNEKSYLSRMVPKFVKEHGRQPHDNDVIDTLKGNYVRDVLNIPTTRTNELESKYGVVFNNPKPVNLIKRLISLVSRDNSIILDFFAGSGTTGQAVQELNREDGGTRSFILVTNNEKSDKLPNGIARDVTYPRLQKTIAEDTNLVYMTVAMVKHEKDSSTSAKIEQLAIKNRMLPLLKVKYNTYITVKETEKYIILKNNNGFHLGVYFNTLGPTRSLGPIRAQFESMLEEMSDNYEAVYNCSFSGYASAYYDMIQATNV
jgi:adenine-specific DNA-methyltransferase